MFNGIELTLYDSDEKILINLDRVGAICQDSEKTLILVGEVFYQVRENYNEIKDRV